MSRPGRRLAVALLAYTLALAGCENGSPTGAGKAGIRLGGSWSGEWRFLSAGITVSDAITATLTQDGSRVSGAWVGTGGATGEWQFAASGATTGSATVRQTVLTGQTCTAVTAITSSVVSASRIEPTLADIPPAGICQWATSQRFVLAR